MFVSALCLSCGRCTSEVSWEDCNSKLTKTTCPSGSPNCVTGKMTCSAGQERKTVFYKRCGAQGRTCDITRSDRPSCPSSPVSWSFDFENTCCTGNNCNSGIVPSGSSHRISSKMTAVNTGLLMWIMTYIYWVQAPYTCTNILVSVTFLTGSVYLAYRNYSYLWNLTSWLLVNRKLRYEWYSRWVFELLVIKLKAAIIIQNDSDL